MKRIKLFFASILLLFSCMAPVTARADSQSTTVRYSVPAIVTYTDFDGTSTTQKVNVGTVLKAPKAKGKPGCVFEGWRNEQTGLLWNFATPVTEHMTLTASYSDFTEDTDGDISIGKGEFSVIIKVENHEADVSIGTSNKDLLNMLLQDESITSEELDQIADGASMEVVLVVKDGTDTISAASKDQMLQNADGYTIGQYLDISLIKYLAVNGEGEVISQTSGVITVSVKVPDHMINTDKNVDRSYIVLRNHEGNVDVLDSKYDADTHMLTFQTNLFSDYAIGYRDVKKSGQESGNTDQKSQHKDTSETPAVSPKTSDTSHIFLYESIFALSAAVMLVVYVRRKKKEE